MPGLCRPSRYLTINTVIRKYTVETTRTGFEMPYSSKPDETALHDEETVFAFSDAVRRGFPEARITWAFSWQALFDDSARYRGLREAVQSLQQSHGDDITFIPGGYFANRYNTRDEINRDVDDALERIEALTGARPRSLVAGFLAAENMRHARERHGIETVQGNIWSQYSVDNQDGDGSPAYPFFPSAQHFCKPAQGASDFIDCLNLDGWTVDFVAARLAGEYWKDGVRYVSRMGAGPLETLHTFDLETGLRQMKATSEAHFCDENVGRNPFGWVTNNYEICAVHDGRERGALEAFSEWVAWIKRTWPDAECPTMAGFGDAVKATYPDNDSLTYLLRQEGSGIGASFAGQQVTWFMNKGFRLGIVREAGADGGGETVSVFDYADYSRDYAEPQGPGERNWSLLGALNQKRLRPQDEPLPLETFLEHFPSAREKLFALYGEQSALHDLMPAGVR